MIVPEVPEVEDGDGGEDERRLGLVWSYNNLHWVDTGQWTQVTSSTTITITQDTLFSGMIVSVISDLRGTISTNFIPFNKTELFPTIGTLR